MIKNLRVALWALIEKLHFKSVSFEGTSPGFGLVLTFAGQNTLVSPLWDTHLTFKVVFWGIEWNNNIYEALSLAHSKLLLKMVAFVIISMNNTIIFIWPMVRKELKGKDQAPCQDFKKKMHDNRAVIFFYKRIYSIYRRIIWQQPIMLMN